MLCIHIQQRIYTWLMMVMFHYSSLYFSFLAKRGVKEEIMSFNARKISPEIRDSVQELLDKNKKSFDPAVSLYVCINM